MEIYSFRIWALAVCVAAVFQTASAQDTTPASQGSPVTAAPDGLAPAPAAPGPIAPSDDAPAPPTRHVVVDSNYLLQPDDVVEVMVFREPDLTTDGMIRKDGYFDMKLIGTVKMAEQTVDQATEAVRAALAKDYLVNPRVTIGVIDYAKKKVNILGEVRVPGVYAFPPRGPLLLSDAVALAGGFLPTADLAHVVVNRTEGSRTVSLDVNAAPGSSGGTDSFALKPDDAITVPLQPRRHFTVLGQVGRPGTYDAVDDRPIYLLDAIALAGGFTRLANPSRVLLKRIENGKEIVLDLNAKAMGNSSETQRVEIENEDTITVNESMF
jgi:protein involved in polysaccharide export with SLBB domain